MTRRPAAASPRVVAVTVARLDGTSPWRRYAVDAPGPGWVPLDALLADDAALDAWYRTELGATARGHADLAGALVVYRLAGALAELVVGTLLDQRRCPELTTAGVALRLGPDARLDGLSVSARRVAVLAGDPDAGADGTVVVDGSAGLRAFAADGLVATYGPVCEAVRARAPYGRRGMWGTLADHLAEVAVRRARERRRAIDSAWAAAAALTDDVAARQPRLRTRPRRETVVAGPATGAAYVAKGTCCLIFKASGPAPAVPGPPHGAPRGGARPLGDAGTIHLSPDDRGSGDRSRAVLRAAGRRLIEAAACASCPLRRRDDRAARCAAYLTTAGPGRP